jgi:peroxiredoxin
MAVTPSVMLPLGTGAPPFSLPDPTGRVVSLDDFAGAPALLVTFICNHCPYVKHLKPALSALAREYQLRNVAVVAINSNDPEAYPDDDVEHMRLDAETFSYTFPYLVDVNQDVAAAYSAACTPEFYVFDADRRLVYRGQFDGSRPGNGVPVTGRDVRAALDAVLEGRPVSREQSPSIGCNIKWRPGRAPEYAR